MDITKFLKEVFKVDAKCLIFLLCVLLILYIGIKIILKLTDMLIGPLFLIFVAAFYLSPDLQEYTKRQVLTKVEFLVQKFGIK